jgi:MFS superfamily sulfate permease-like transporter
MIPKATVVSLTRLLIITHEQKIEKKVWNIKKNSVINYLYCFIWNFRNLIVGIVVSLLTSVNVLLWPSSDQLVRCSRSAASSIAGLR